HSRQIDMPSAAQLALGENFAIYLLAALREHLHLNGAIINEHDISDIGVVNKILVIHIHRAFFLAPFAAQGQRKLLARLQIEREEKLSGANGWIMGLPYSTVDHLMLASDGADVL